jgi:hypothetical protein
MSTGCKRKVQSLKPLILNGSVAHSLTLGSSLSSLLDLIGQGRSYLSFHSYLFMTSGAIFSFTEDELIILLRRRPIQIVFWLTFTIFIMKPHTAGFTLILKLLGNSIFFHLLSTPISKIKSHFTSYMKNVITIFAPRKFNNHHFIPR